MKPEENTYFHKDNIMSYSIFDNGYMIVYDSIYDEKIKNDPNKPRLGLLYEFDSQDNKDIVTLSKIDRNTSTPIHLETAKALRIDSVKDKTTFLNFAKNLCQYCTKYNCNFATALLFKEERIEILKSRINAACEVIDKKLSYIIFDEDCEKAFTLWDNNRIDCCGIQKDGQSFWMVISKIMKEQPEMNSLEEFEEFIKKNRKVLDKTIIENTAKIKAKELEKLASVSEEFQNHGMERK